MARWRRRSRRSSIPIFKLTIASAAFAYFSGLSAGAVILIGLALAALVFTGFVMRQAFQPSLSLQNRSAPEPDTEVVDSLPYPSGSFGTRYEQLSVKKRPTSWTLGLLRSLEWKRFEEVAAEYYRLQGFKAEVTRTGADGGVDIILRDMVSNDPISMVQCKAWNTRQVGVKPIRELLGVITHNKVSLGLFMTTADFSGEAKTFAEMNGLVLIGGEEFLGEIKKLDAEKQKKLLEFATQGDYTIPTCPRCDSKMVLRRGSFKSFWGCRNFPRCRHKFYLSAA